MTIWLPLNLRSPSEMSGTKSAALLAGLLVLCFGVAALGGISTVAGVRDWYPGLSKPPWTPPSWAFGPIWTVLYAAMAVAIWDVLRLNQWREARAAAALFAVQLAMNAAWSPMFFAWHQTAAGLAILTLLWAAILVCIVVYRPLSRLGALLMVPYLGWVSVAWTLNAWIYWFNEVI